MTQEEAQGKQYLLKMIILGDSGVGKTSLLNVYIKDHFSLEYKATIGADFLTKKIQKGEENWQLQLWDTAGTEKHHALAQGFYRGSECCLLVFDVTDKQTFDDLESWKTEFLNKLNPPDPETFPFVLIANKIDLERSISTEVAKAFADKHKIPYFECSAKEGTNIKEAFEKAAEMAHERAVKNEDVVMPTMTRVEIVDTHIQKKSCAC